MGDINKVIIRGRAAAAADLVRGLISCAEVEAAINGTKE